MTFVSVVLLLLVISVPGAYGADGTPEGGPVTLEVLNPLAMLEVKRIAPAPRVTDFFKEDIGWRNSLSAISIQN